MRDLYKILEVLQKKGTYFCFQSGGIHQFLNLAVEVKGGKRKHYRHGTIDEVEAELLLTHGHLLGRACIKVELPKPTSSPHLEVMPLPPMPVPIPMPGIPNGK